MPRYLPLSRLLWLALLTAIVAAVAWAFGAEPRAALRYGVMGAGAAVVLRILVAMVLAVVDSQRARRTLRSRLEREARRAGR